MLFKQLEGTKDAHLSTNAINTVFRMQLIPGCSYSNSMEVF